MIWVVRRPVATWMITIALFVFGTVSYKRLPLNLMPDLSYPTVTIRTEADGYAPEEVEEQISRRIEEAVATTQGIAKLESRSRAGRSEVLLSFKWGSDINQSIQDARERLQRVFFEEDVRRPLILRYDPSLDPILRLSLSQRSDPGKSAQRNLSELRSIADKQIKRKLEALDGVAAVRIRGGMEREAQVLIREEWMAARGLTIGQITQTLAAENINLPGGSILEGDREYLVRTLNSYKSIEDLRSIRIRRQDGVEVGLDEVAEIRDGYKDRSVMGRIDGMEAVELEVYKAADANIVQVASSLKEQLLGTGTRGPPEGGPQAGNQRWDKEQKSIQETMPEGISLTLLEDQAAFIESALRNLVTTGLAGAGLAVVILFLFLRDFRSTAIIATAIPLSIFVTFAPMFIWGVSLNLMSLGGLALGVGMLVDNAVVVLENIQVHLEAGEDRKTAASKGTSEIAMAVTASTMTTICVFLPIGFVEGAAGQVFGDLSLAVVFSLLASLAVALFFVPMLAAAEVEFSGDGERPTLRSRFTAIDDFRADWQSRGGVLRILWLLWGLPRFAMTLVFNILATAVIYPTAAALWLATRLAGLLIPPLRRGLLAVADSFYGLYSRAEDIYSRGVGPMLRRPYMVLASAAALLAITVPLGSELGQSLLPDVAQGRFAVDAELPIGTPLGKTAAAVLPVERSLSTDPDVSYVYSILGSDSRVDDNSGSGEHSARLMIGMEPGGDMEAKETRLMSLAREKLSGIESVQNIQLRRPALFSFQTPMELVLFSPELEELRTLSKKALEALSDVPGLKDLRSSLSAGYPEVQIRYDRDQLRRLGLDASTAAEVVRDKIQGERATRISDKEQRIDLSVRLVEGARRSLVQLRRLNINPAVNPPIPLASVASFIETEGPSEIRRIDQQRAVVLTANIKGFDLSGPASGITQRMEAMEDMENSWELSGQSEEMRRSLDSMKFALYLAVFLVYVIMASSFESLLHPFVILFSVPLASIGVLAALWALDIPLSVVVFIGAIVLAGVVVNNAIVLVDTINRKRAGGAALVEATHEAARLRLRPILITTLTTALGLLPLALGLGDGSEIQQPLAITVIAGLLSSTFLTLVVIPAAYVQVARATEGPR
jgi:hydrophobic/amphiphilic exporter-1 (mainly G- bacteria), HAE1 family